ncbi:MAG: FecR domain-containing protein [Burkholderiaceae bacterium]|nr:FecR domain-containing protein [Burkholderiaceae bacterium]
MKFSTPSVLLKRAALALGVAAAMAAQAQTDAVGEVTMTIGQAMTVQADGTTFALQRGSKVRAGDRIETAEGGHVHIRFVDGALVSVRPTSRLVVEDYQYNASNVALSLVRFRLDKGITRAISGAAAEGARDRFRLNTPLVAIGVKGTDFVVRTWADQTVAAVNQGAIVMAPFDAGCTMQASGPCGSSAARLLSADMGNVLVEFRTTLAQPEIKPFNGARAPEPLLATSEPHGPAEPSRDSGKPLLRTVNDEVVAAAIVEGAVRLAKDGLAISSSAPVVIVSNPGEAVRVVPPDLAWGRWGAGLGVEDLAVMRADAAAGRQATVGNSDYILYRTENGPAVMAQNLGNVNFALQQSQASFTSAAGRMPAAVQSGALAIDFAAGRFATNLNLNSAATGNVGFQASGYVRSDGIFNAVASTQAMAGATSLDGSTAGYFFEKAAAGGLLSGITLWRSGSAK